jgi:hypothetical protein
MARAFPRTTSTTKSTTSTWTVFLPVTNMTLGNLSDVVKAGVWSWADICKGIDTTDVCKKNQ